MTFKKALFYCNLINPFWWIRRWRQAAIERRKEFERVMRGLEGARLEGIRRRETERARCYPEVLLTQEEFDRIKNSPSADLDTCPLGTWFIYKKQDAAGITVLGQVVAGDKLIASQWGAGLCVPERGANSYRLKLVEQVPVV